MKVILLSLIIGFSLCFSTTSHAALLTLQADRSHYQLGDQVQVSLWLSELPDVVGGFWARLHYQPTALSWQSAQFADGFAGDSLQYLKADPAAGVITLEEYAFWDADVSKLSARQGQRFTLASFSFVATQAGQFSLTLATDFLGAETFSGSVLSLHSQPLQLTIQQVAMPASWTLWLLAGLLFGRRFIR